MDKQYRLYVGTDDINEPVPMSIWGKFLRFHFGATGSYPSYNDIDDILDRYNAIDDTHSCDLIFESEEDMLIFKLKYG